MHREKKQNKTQLIAVYYAHHHRGYEKGVMSCLHFDLNKHVYLSLVDHLCLCWFACLFVVVEGKGRGTIGLVVFNFAVKVS